MSNDHIVEELRECATHAGGEGYTYNVMRRAAAEISRLRAELQALKARMAEPVAWARRADLDDPSDCLFVSRYQYLATDYSVALYTATPPPAQDVSTLPPFAEKVLAKLRRFEECAEDSDSGGVDIGRHWLDLLTQLALLNRVQRSPGLWEISQQGEDFLAAHRQAQQQERQP